MSHIDQEDFIKALDNIPEMSDEGIDIRLYAHKIADELLDETMLCVDEYVSNASMYATLWEKLSEAEATFSHMHKVITDCQATINPIAKELGDLRISIKDNDHTIQNDPIPNAQNSTKKIGSTYQKVTQGIT